MAKEGWNEYDGDKVLNLLLSFCRSCKKIYLYGAGDFGTFYAGLLKHFPVTLSGFIVSKNKPAKEYMGLPLYELAEIYGLLESDDGIVLSLRECFHISIRMALPRSVSVLGLNDRQSMVLQSHYIEEVIGNNIRDILLQSGLVLQLRTDMAMQHEMIRILSGMCNENAENPDTILGCRSAYFNRTEKTGPFSRFPIRDTAIVMQGPIRKDFDFTLQTALFYRKIYPFAPIVISTWKEEADERFSKICADNHLILLENDLPQNSGFTNSNYQMTSSFNGIQHISKDPDIRYVLKTRTDQRICKEDILIHLRSMLAAYPPAGKAMRFRIFLDQIGAFPFWILDFSAFGAVEDMLRYYSPRLCVNGEYTTSHLRRYETTSKLMLKAWDYYRDGRFDHFKTLLQNGKRVKNLGRRLYKFIAPEIWIPQSFYDQYIEKIEPERVIEQYIDFLTKYVVSMDGIEWMMYWNKYEKDRLKFFGGASMRYDWMNVFYNLSETQ